MMFCGGKMATVLVTSLPLFGHCFQLLKVAQALKQIGITVIFLIHPDFEGRIRDKGFEVITLDITFVPGQSPMELAEDLSSLTEKGWDLAQEAVCSTSFDAVLYDAFCTWGYLLAKTRKVPAISLSTSTPFFSDNFIREYTLAPQDRFFTAPVRILKSFWNCFGGSYRLFKRTGVLIPKPLDFFCGSGDLQLSSSIEEFAYSRPGVHWIGTDVEHQSWDLGVDPEWLEGDLVFISFGTISQLTLPYYESLVSQLAGKPYKVLITSKLAASQLTDLPSNVKICPFVNQIEVLKRTKVFVSHCGLNSLYEAASCGVPIVAAPEQNDQYFNARKLETFGGCIWPSRETFIDDLPGAIETLLSDPSYSESMRKLNSYREAAGGPTRAAKLIRKLLLG
jgi:MGT family glycosyltransferase